MKMKICIAGLSLLVMSVLLPGCGGGGGDTAPTSGGSITLNWVPPIVRDDGSSLDMSDISGYKIYMGASPDDLKLYAEISDAYTTKHVINNVESGVYYFSITAFSSDNLESEKSNVVSKTI